MACRSEEHRKRAIVLAAIATSWALAACGGGPRYVVWPGTPPPSRPAPHADRDAQALAARPLDEKVVVHPPFRDGRCGACHANASGGGPLVSSADQLCAGCHADAVRTTRPHAGARPCLGCHSRHVSMAPGRLSGEGRRAAVR